ncbi:MAG: HAD-IA family hydrolase [Nitrospinae bacterium]|nr:HAD-IA family hydrolase [Nitrospinota bacterium]
MPFDLIIFDLDGTLIDSKIDIANSVRHTLRQLGLRDVPPEIIYTFVGRGVEPLIRKSLAEAGDGNIDEALSIFRRHYDEHLLDNTASYPMVEDVLKSLSDINKVVLTNKMVDFAVKTLKGLAIDRHFLDIFGGDSFPTKKPNPEGLRYIFDKFGAKPKNTLVVGDSGVDIEAGQRAGAVTCGVTYGYRSAEELRLQGADYMVDNFLEIIDIVRS